MMLLTATYLKKDHRVDSLSYLCNKDGKTAPIQWQSRKIRHVVKSTLAAECLAQVEAAVKHAF